VLVGINLLREGLDIPEVSLVAILDADKEGFLRSPRSLIQTIGRAARNVRGEVIMYADRITAAMRRAMDETGRRRELQAAYNEKHGIIPETIRREILNIMSEPSESDYVAVPLLRDGEADEGRIKKSVDELRSQMLLAAEQLDFERAAEVRDQIARLKGSLPEPPAGKSRRSKAPARRRR
jgi:excinuclease ABC subunit B